jgi:hypothetical protein
MGRKVFDLISEISQEQDWATVYAGIHVDAADGPVAGSHSMATSSAKIGNNSVL